MAVLLQTAAMMSQPVCSEGPQQAGRPSAQSTGKLEGLPMHEAGIAMGLSDREDQGERSIYLSCDMPMQKKGIMILMQKPNNSHWTTE